MLVSSNGSTGKITNHCVPPPQSLNCLLIAPNPQLGSYSGATIGPAPLMNTPSLALNSLGSVFSITSNDHTLLSLLHTLRRTSVSHLSYRNCCNPYHMLSTCVVVLQVLSLTYLLVRLLSIRCCSYRTHL